MSPTPRRPTRFGRIQSAISVAIIGAMAGVVVPGVDAFVQQNRSEVASTQLLRIAGGFQHHRKDTGSWPTPRGAPMILTGRDDLGAYETLFLPGCDLPGWSGPYLTASAPGEALNDAAPDGSQTLDPWGHAYLVYSFAPGYDGTRGGLVLLSAGADGFVQSGDEQIFNCRAGGDDLARLITFNLH